MKVLIITQVIFFHNSPSLSFQNQAMIWYVWTHKEQELVD